MEDIAILTGGQVISKDKGLKLDKLSTQQIAQYLGSTRLVTVSKEETTIIDGKGDEATLANRATEIKDQIDKATSFYEREKLQERLGKLIGGVAIISVGGNSDIEIKEKKDRVEDALYATKAALADGIVPGGGATLYRVALNHRVESNNNVAIARDIVRAALQAPFKKILSNAGIENWYENIPTEGKVYDAKNHKMVDAVESGIIDPAKVVITAVKNAASVAGTILTTESVVFEKKEKDEKGQDPMMGMGMM
jgi:chaperonin GroEL